MILSLEEDPKIEEFILENGNKRVIKYLGEAILGEGLESYPKSCADYILEEIYDSEGNLISKKYNMNPHKNIKLGYHKGAI